MEPLAEAGECYGYRLLLAATPLVRERPYVTTVALPRLRIQFGWIP